MRWRLFLSVGALVACKSASSTPPARFSLEALGGERFALVPLPGQLPYCLAYTVSERGVLRQLVRPVDERAPACPAGERIGGTVFRAPHEEGTVKALVLFASEPLRAKTISTQLGELKNPGAVRAVDIRAPGETALGVLEFHPSPGTAQ